MKRLVVLLGLVVVGACLAPPGECDCPGGCAACGPDAGAAGVGGTGGVSGDAGGVSASGGGAVGADAGGVDAGVDGGSDAGRPRFDAGSMPAAFAAFIEDHAVAVCRRAIRCRTGVAVSEQECVQMVRVYWDPTSRVRSVELGLEQFDEDAGRRALAELEGNCRAHPSLARTLQLEDAWGFSPGFLLPSTQPLGLSCQKHGRSCGRGTACDVAAGRCLGSCVPEQVTGAPCSFDGQCGAGRYCSATRRCEALRLTGSNCIQSTECELSAYCDRGPDGGRVCLSSALVGQPCSQGYACTQGAYCENAICRLKKLDGAACAQARECAAGKCAEQRCSSDFGEGSACDGRDVECVAGVGAPELVCDLIAHRCRVKQVNLPEGAACGRTARACAFPLQCRGSVVFGDDAGISGVCGRPELYDRCAGASECPRHSMCVSGVCEPIGPGDPCAAWYSCPANLRCVRSATGARCEAGVPTGSACVPSAFGYSVDACENLGDFCLPLSDAGASCRPRGHVGEYCESTETCAFGLACVAGRCVGVGHAGERCLNAFVCIDGACLTPDGGLQGPDPRVCQAKSGEGAPCWSTADCQTGVCSGNEARCRAVCL